MSWISGSCQGDRDWKCYYENLRTGETWCKDVSGSSGCPSWDNGGVLANEVRVGGGW